MSDDSETVIEGERSDGKTTIAHFADSNEFAEVSHQDTAEALRQLADKIDDDADPRPNNCVKEGVCCIECKSVIFNVGKLLRHIENRNHMWFKSGDDLVLRADTLTANEWVFEE